MDNVLQTLFERAETWPEAARDELLRVAHKIEPGLQGAYHATAEELEGIDRGLASAGAGAFAPEHEVTAAFSKFQNA